MSRVGEILNKFNKPVTSEKPKRPAVVISTDMDENGNVVLKDTAMPSTRQAELDKLNGMYSQNNVKPEKDNTGNADHLAKAQVKDIAPGSVRTGFNGGPSVRATEVAAKLDNWKPRKQG